ncbi:Hypp3348 [Branchiostoma lanceolatum]|uniref:Hypp3348 protein n=1 Tax=Branchiostoma lanceolatum TaxID=7740 RepID=A0A8K0A252_BRALA|nr:Hypp3348 [Branchiostoma lanceolatum]
MYAAVATDVLQVMRAGHQLIPNRMYGGRDLRIPDQSDPQEMMANQAECITVESYAEARLSRIEAITSQDFGVQCLRREENTHTYTYVKDDVHSARQIVEAHREHHYVNEEGRYETIPNELGCTGVEPYAEIGLSDIAARVTTVQGSGEYGGDAPDHLHEEYTEQPQTSM